MDLNILAKRRYALLSALAEKLGVGMAAPSTKVDPLIREMFVAEALEKLSENIAEVSAKLDDIEARVAQLEAKPRKTAAK